MAEDLANILEAKTPSDVLDMLAEDLGPEGFQRKLDADHTASFLARGSTLIVNFETLDQPRLTGADGLPVAHDFVEDKNWSLLHLAAHRPTWFRSPAIYDFFDELVDEEFFEEFESVIFFGAGANGYAAAAYSVAAPGAVVFTVSPQATLDAERAGWDRRHKTARMRDFTTRYGFAPDMVEGARAAYVLYDPFRALDHVHASLFHGPNVVKFRCRHFANQIDQALFEMDALHQTIELAATNELSPAAFFGILRRRRNHNRYLRTLMHALDQHNRPFYVAMLCKHVLNRKRGPAFAKRLAEIRQVLSERGDLPDWLTDPEP